MITYEITSGILMKDGEELGRGYSGQPDFKNDPTACSIHNKGPIPPGLYTIGDPVDTHTHGPYVLPLTPDPSNEMYGRSGFLIHGDSVVEPGTASEGCIIMPRLVRVAVHESNDRDLQVVP